MFTKKNLKLYIFKKPLTMPFKICKNLCKTLNNLIFNQETKYVQISFNRLFAKMCNFFRKTCAISFLMS